MKWIKLEDMKPCIDIKKLYVVAWPTEIGGYDFALANYHGDDCFYCSATGDEIDGVTHYAEVSTTELY